MRIGATTWRINAQRAIK